MIWRSCSAYVCRFSFDAHDVLVILLCRFPAFALDARRNPQSWMERERRMIMKSKRVSPSTDNSTLADFCCRTGSVAPLVELNIAIVVNQPHQAHYRSCSNQEWVFAISIRFQVLFFTRLNPFALRVRAAKLDVDVVHGATQRSTVANVVRSTMVERNCFWDTSMTCEASQSLITLFTYLFGTVSFLNVNW